MSSCLQHILYATSVVSDTSRCMNAWGDIFCAISGPSEACMCGKKVVMYDEPTAGLDPVASTVVEDLIRSLQSQRGMGNRSEGISSYIVVTHQHSTIRRAVDRLIFLHEVILWVLACMCNGSLNAKTSITSSFNSTAVHEISALMKCDGYLQLVWWVRIDCKPQRQPHRLLQSYACGHY